MLTVAVICKNEERNIVRCLESVFRNSHHLEPEVLLVDSWSEDATVELARRFPVKIVRLREQWPHSPAAGRFTAVNCARGRYLFVLDGDMELLPAYLEQAIAFLERTPEAGGVRGRLHNYHSVDGQAVYVNTTQGANDAPISGKASGARVQEISVVTGAALFRVSALRAAGNFHPYLKAEEEFEICQRLRRLGSRLYGLPLDAVNHHGYLPNPLDELRRRWRAGLIGGIGQMVRLSFEGGYARHALWRFRQHLCLGVFSLALPFCLLAAFSFPGLLVGWGLTFTGLFAAHAANKRDATHGIAALLLKCLIGVEILRGMFRRVPDSGTYPRDVLVAQDSLGMTR